MNKPKKRLTTILFIALLVSSMATFLIAETSAHTPPWNIPTFAHIYAATNPIGVGQQASIYLFLTPTYADTLMTNDYRFHNYELIITAPNGKVTTQKWDTIWDTTSNQIATFTPDQVGVYNLTFIFPGQYVNDYPRSPTSAYLNDYYLPSNATTTLTVQEDPILELPVNPLPTEYWSRPIYGENPFWYIISSNWLGSGMPGYGGMNGPNQRQFAPDAVGSQTAHIMWTKSLQPGGVVGGNNFEILGDTYFEGTAYQQRYVNPIIVYGRIYYKEPFSFSGTGGDTVCVDLQTGEEVWRKSDIPALSFAYISGMHTPNYHGVYPAILFTSNFGNAYDADTGKPLFNVTGVPSGASVIGPLGEMIKYNFFNNGTTSNPDWYLTQWNSSRMWSGSSTAWNIQTTTTTTTTWQWENTTIYVNNVPQTQSKNVTTTTQTTAVQASRGIFYDSISESTQNKSISWRKSMPNTPTILGAIYNDILLCRNGSYPALGDNGQPYTYFAVDINKSRGTFGNVLWWKTVNQPEGNITTISFAGMDPSGYFCESYRQTQQFAFFNLRTGEFIRLSEPQAALDYYGSNGPGTLSNVVAYGRVYSCAYSGILYCYDMSTGKLLWTYGNGGVPGNTTYSGFEVPGPYPTFINAIGNGIIYTVTSEHTFQTPIYKGALARAINATDGTEIWTLSAATGEFAASSYAIADGYSTFFNSYDQQIYSLGRGPSKTSVQVGPKSLTLGGNVVIEGTVTDISAGTKQHEQASRFPDGVPVCADSSMKDWMGYVYQQKPKPENFTGVNVNIVILDANNNYRMVSATTDSRGTYSVTWTPEIPGDYKITASFEGTNGYWPSSSATTFNVVEPEQPTPSPTPMPVSLVDQYFPAAVAAIIVSIFIVGAILALLMLKKRP
jgi:outer membrane protein assembly factor BamB